MFIFWLRRHAAAHACARRHADAMIRRADAAAAFSIRLRCYATRFIA